MTEHWTHLEAIHNTALLQAPTEDGLWTSRPISTPQCLEQIPGQEPGSDDNSLP